MRNIKTLILLHVVLFSAGITSAQVELIKTDNGHTLYFLPLPESKNVSIQATWLTNWATTEGRNQAVPHVAAQLMLAGGAGDWGPAELTEKFQDLQASASIVNQVESIRGVLTSPAKEIDEVVAIANTVLGKPSFDERWLKRLGAALTNNQKQLNSTLAKIAMDITRYSLFRDQALIESQSLMNVDSVAMVTQAEVALWHEETITQSGLTLVITGPLSPQKAGQLADRLLLGLPKGQVRQKVVPEIDFTAKTILLHDPKRSKSLLGFVGALPPTSEGFEFEDLVASILLGQGENSELFKAIRTELGASYSFSSMPFNFLRDVRVLQMFGEVETSKLAEAHQVAVHTYEAFINKKSHEQAENLIKAIAPNIERNRNNAPVMAGAIMESLLDGHDPSRALNLAQELAAVSSDSIVSRLQVAYPKIDELITIVVSPDKNFIPGACIISAPEEAAYCL
ncbi:MAG: M16 family metallopeptidase [Pseudohongiellaceae bacterium]